MNWLKFTLFLDPDLHRTKEKQRCVHFEQYPGPFSFFPPDEEQITYNTLITWEASEQQ